MITKINGKEYLFVEVPEKAYDFSLNERRMEVSANIDKNLITNDWFSDPLPEGNYTVIGKADNLSEHQWKGIVENWDATEGGLSLIKSIGMKPENCLVIIKNANP